MPVLSIDMPGGVTSKSSTPWSLKPSAFRTSPLDKVHKALLQFKCEKLALQFYTKLQSCPSSSAYVSASSILGTSSVLKIKEKSIKPFGLGLEPTLEKNF